MNKQNRIPAITDKSSDALENWFAELYASGLLFHPDDRPEDIVSMATGEPTFTPAECKILRESLAVLFDYHGDSIYEVALKYAHQAVGIRPVFASA
jgi:hypothetical protein